MGKFTVYQIILAHMSGRNSKGRVRKGLSMDSRPAHEIIGKNVAFAPAWS
jgi:hypothetical protein